MGNIKRRKIYHVTVFRSVAKAKKELNSSTSCMHAEKCMIKSPILFRTIFVRLEAQKEVEMLIIASLFSSDTCICGIHVNLYGADLRSWTRNHDLLARDDYKRRIITCDSSALYRLGFVWGFHFNPSSPSFSGIGVVSKMDELQLKESSRCFPLNCFLGLRYFLRH